MMERAAAADLPGGASPLQRVLLVVGVLAALALLVFSLTEGTANERFLQVGMSVGLLVYLATLVDLLLGLAFLIVCIGFSPELSLGGIQQLRLEDFIVPALLLGWGGRASKDRNPLIPLRVGAIVGLYFVAALLSSLVGLAAGHLRVGAALPLLGKYVEYFVIFLIVLQNVRTPGEFRALAVLSVGVAVAGVALGTAREDRLHGPSGETANIYGGYLVLHLGVTVGLLLHARTGGWRLVCLAAALLLGHGVLQTHSRTSFAALVGSVLAFGLLKERRVLPLLLACGALAPLLASEALLARLSTIGDVARGAGPSSWESRVYSWETTLGSMSGADWLWGRGLGSVDLGWVDSEYVRILADMGLLGLFLFAIFLLTVGRHANAIYENLPAGGLHKGYAAGYLIALGALVVHGIAATSFTSIRTMEAFMVLTAMAFAQGNRAVEWGLAERTPWPGSAGPPAAPAPVYRM